MLLPTLKKTKKSKKVVPIRSGNVNAFFDFLSFFHIQPRRPTVKTGQRTYVSAKQIGLIEQVFYKRSWNELKKQDCKWKIHALLNIDEQFGTDEIGKQLAFVC
jgi:hypothetical protein